MSDDAQAIHRAEAIDLVSNTAVIGVLFGIGFTLYCNCVQLMIKDFRNGDRPRQTAISFVYSSLIVFCAAVSFGTNVQLRILAYINHNDTLDVSSTYVGPLYQNNEPLYILNGFSPVVMEVLIMAMEVQLLYGIPESTHAHSSF
jgi:hypothetical protein